MRPVARQLARLGVLALLVTAQVTGVAFSEATFSGSMPVTGNQLGATSWLMYLHNNPTPPSGDTVAQFGLPASAAVPTATTLYNYDIDCDGRAGRTLLRGGGTVGETGACAHATWRGPVYGSPILMDGTITLDIWARKTANGGAAPSLIAHLRAYDPVGGTYTEIGSGSVAVSGNGFDPYTIGITVINHTFTAGSQLELKLVASGGARDIDIAYDTVAYPAALDWFGGGTPTPPPPPPSGTVYLQNDPTPPTGDTVALFALTADNPAPTAVTLHNYDTDCDGRLGRTLTVGTGGVGEVATCFYANWRTGAYDVDTTLNGTVSVTIYARKSANGGASPTLHVFLRQYDPTTGTYTEVASGSSAVAVQASQPFAAFTFSLAVSHTFDAASMIELKLAATGTNRNVDIAYDVVAYPSNVTLP